MAKKESENNTKPEVSSGEIGTIRDILMGHQISQNEDRFNEIEARIKRMEEHFNNKLKNLETKADEQHKFINDDFHKKMETLENLLITNQDRFHEKMDMVKRQERERLSTLLGQLSKNLLDD